MAPVFQRMRKFRWRVNWSCVSPEYKWFFWRSSCNFPVAFTWNPASCPFWFSCYVYVLILLSSVICYFQFRLCWTGLAALCMLSHSHVCLSLGLKLLPIHLYLDPLRSQQARMINLRPHPLLIWSGLVEVATISEGTNIIHTHKN